MGKKYLHLPSVGIITHFLFVFEVIMTTRIMRTKARQTALVGKCSQQRHMISKTLSQLFRKLDRPETGTGIKPQNKDLRL